MLGSAGVAGGFGRPGDPDAIALRSDAIGLRGDFAPPARRRPRARH